MRVRICAPSYKRPEGVLTFRYLPFVRAYVDPGEYAEYKKQNPGREIVKCAPGIQGNVSRVRNYILDCEFKSGADAVAIVDDDLTGMYCWEKKEMVFLPSEKFIPFIEKYSRVARDLGAFFWGVNLNQDKQLYREYSPFSTVSPVLGPFGVFLKGNECRYDERLNLKEDYDMSLQQLNKYRVVLRANKFFYSCKQSEQAGGCATYRNFQREKEQLELLQKKWGAKIVKQDRNVRSHNLKKQKVKIDYNPILNVPIRGI